jgi:HD-like signal output (HDOD) protein/ActR/RegA family two-component response regulator
MARNNTRALVIDDDAVSRQILLRALGQEGLECDAAADGRQARAFLATQTYDVVVTDLQMPNGNGHALCVDLLSRQNRPVIVVVTGITVPMLAQDLLARGVDDVMYKPVDLRLLSTKVKALIDRRRARLQEKLVTETPPRGSLDRTVEIRPAVVRRVDASELDAKILGLAQLLPVSPAALDVVEMTTSEVSVQRIAAAILRDPALTAQLLKLANSPFYNPTGQQLVDLAAAVVRIGTKRIGELAVATAALHGLTASRLPWLDVDLTWRRSLAAGLAVERLAAQAGLTGDNAGLFLSALMHGLGRVVLGSVYPELYKAMIAACQQSRTSLLDEERRVFPHDHSAVMARVLESWKVPPRVYQPLKHFSDSYVELEGVSEPLRTKAELIKIAALIGELAAGKWEPWRGVEIPSTSVLARLNLRDIGTLVHETRTELPEFAKSQPRKAPLRGPFGPVAQPSPNCTLAYLPLSHGRFDFLEEIIRLMGIELITVSPESLATFDAVVVNCLGVPAKRLAGLLSTVADGQERLIITDEHRLSEYSGLGDTLALPASYAALQHQCRDARYSVSAVPMVLK